MPTDIFSRFREQLRESEASDRSFGLVAGIGFIAIGLVRRLRAGEVRWWALGVGTILLMITAVAPATLRRPKQTWLFLGFLLGLVVNPVVLGILFFVVVTPAAALLRLFGHDPLRLRKDTAADSYWHERAASVPDMRLQF